MKSWKNFPKIVSIDYSYVQIVSNLPILSIFNHSYHEFMMTSIREQTCIDPSNFGCGFHRNDKHTKRLLTMNKMSNDHLKNCMWQTEIFCFSCAANVYKLHCLLNTPQNNKNAIVTEFISWNRLKLAKNIIWFHAISNSLQIWSNCWNKWRRCWNTIFMICFLIWFWNKQPTDFEDFFKRILFLTNEHTLHWEMPTL